MNVPENLRARANQPPASPLDQVRSFLRSYVADAGSLAEVRADLARMAEVNPENVRRRLRAIEALLADPPTDGSLMKLVGWDANWVLDNPSDASAAAWLSALAELIREVLDETRSADLLAHGRISRGGAG